MKNYDFQKAVQIIEKNKENLKSASLGMHEDWFYTAATVWEDGDYRTNLTQEDLKIAGIAGSMWATPVLELEFIDGTEKTVNCYTGESEKRKPEMYLGVLSAPAQELRNKIELED